MQQCSYATKKFDEGKNDSGCGKLSPKQTKKNKRVKPSRQDIASIVVARGLLNIPLSVMRPFFHETEMFVGRASMIAFVLATCANALGVQVFRLAWGDDGAASELPELKIVGSLDL